MTDSVSLGKYSFTVLQVCLGSLPDWKIKPLAKSLRSPTSLAQIPKS